MGQTAPTVFEEASRRSRRGQVVPEELSISGGEKKDDIGGND